MIFPGVLYFSRVSSKCGNPERLSTPMVWVIPPHVGFVKTSFRAHHHSDATSEKCVELPGSHRSLTVFITAAALYTCDQTSQDFLLFSSRKLFRFETFVASSLHLFVKFEFFLNNTNLTFLAFLYKIIIIIIFILFHEYMYISHVFQINEHFFV